MRWSEERYHAQYDKDDNIRKENVSVISGEINGTGQGLNDAQLVICGDDKCKLIQNKEIKDVNFTANSAKGNHPITVHMLFSTPG